MAVQPSVARASRGRRPCSLASVLAVPRFLRSHSLPVYPPSAGLDVKRDREQPVLVLRRDLGAREAARELNGPLETAVRDLHLIVQDTFSKRSVAPRSRNVEQPVDDLDRQVV